MSNSLMQLSKLTEILEYQYDSRPIEQRSVERPFPVGMILHKYIQRTPRQDALDALSSLLTGPGNICTSVCIDPNGQLLVANNDGKYGYALDVLRQLQNNSLEESVKKKALEKVASLAKNRKITKRFQDKISSELKNSQLSEDSIKEIKNQTKRKLAEEILAPVNNFQTLF